MGRHGAPPPRVSIPTGPRLRSTLLTWAERAGLGLAAGGGTWGVLQWAGTTSSTALWAAGGAVLAVPAAAWAASKLPGHEQHEAAAEHRSQHPSHHG